MATEINIQESVFLKKGEREENALTSESFEEKETEVPGNITKQLETSSLVAETVNTPGKPTNESETFFQALSVPMVIVDEHSNKPESCKAAKKTEPQEENEEKANESEVCEKDALNKDEAEVGSKLFHSMVPGKKVDLNMVEKNQGDSDGVTSSQDAACEDIKETAEQHATTVADFKVQDLNSEVVKEETEDKSVDALEASEQCEIESKDIEEQTFEENVKKIEQVREIKPNVELEKREQNGLLQAITSDASVSTETKSHVETAEHEQKDEGVNVLEEDHDKDKITNTQEMAFKGDSQKNHHNEDDEHQVVETKEIIEEDNDVCVSTQTDLVEKEVCEDKEDPKKTEFEEALQISDSVAPSQKETFNVLEKDEGDSDGVTSSQEANIVAVEKTSTDQHVTTMIDFKEQDLNEKPREFTEEETEDKSLDAQEASEECENGAKKEIEEISGKGVKKIEKVKETEESVTITQTNSQIEISEHEEEEICEETGSEKVEYEKEVEDSAAAIINKDKVEDGDEKKEQEVSELEKDEGEDGVTSSQEVAFEKVLQEKIHHNEKDESEDVTVEETIEKDSEDIRSSEKMEQQMQIDSIPSDVCISTPARLEEEKTNKNDEEATGRDDAQINKPATPIIKEIIEGNVLEKTELEEAKDKSVDAQEETEQYDDGANDKKEQNLEESIDESANSYSKNEQEEYVEEIKPRVETIEEKGVCILTQIEPQEDATKNEENDFVSDGDRKDKSDNPFVKEVCDENDLKKTESEEEKQLSDSSHVKTKESIVADNEGRVKHSDGFDTTLNENEILSKEEKLEKEEEINTSEVQGGEDDITSSQTASSKDIKETTNGHHDTNVTYVEEGQGVSATPKEILIEEAADKPVDAQKISLELGQPNEQYVEETNPWLSKTISEYPEDEIKKGENDLSQESVEDTNDDTTKEEKGTLEQDPVEENRDQDDVSKEKVIDLNETTEIETQEDTTRSTSLETSTKDNSVSDKEKSESENLPIEDLETVSNIQILELVAKSKDSTLNEECFISETETNLDKEKQTVTEKNSSDEKTEFQSDGDDVTSLKNTSNEDIQETTIDQHVMAHAYIKEGEGMNATSKVILVEEAEYKSTDVEEHEPVEEDNGRDEISKEEITDLNETTEVEPQKDITPSRSLETSKEDNLNSDKEKVKSDNLSIEDLDTVSEVTIPKMEPKSEESVLKEECFISETKTCLDKEKEILNEEILTDEKTEQIAEIKQEAVKEVYEDTNLEKVEFQELKLSDSSTVKIDEKEITNFINEDQEKDHEVNMSAESQDKDDFTSSRYEVSEEKEDLQENNYHNEFNEGDFVKSGEGVDEDTEEIKSSFKTKEITQHAITTNVFSSSQIHADEVIIENEEKISDKAIENDDNEIVSKEKNLEKKQDDVEETKIGDHVSTVAYYEEGQSLDLTIKDVSGKEDEDRFVVTQEETDPYDDGANDKKEQKPEKHTDESITSVETNEEKDVCISTQVESQEDAIKNEEHATENDGDQKEKLDDPYVKEVCEENDLKKTESEEEKQIPDSFNVITRESVVKDTKEPKFSDDTKENMGQQELFDVYTSTQTVYSEKTTEDKENYDDVQTDKLENSLVEAASETASSEMTEFEEVKHSDNFSTTRNEDETLINVEKLEEEQMIKTSEVQGDGDDVTSSQNASNKEMKETMIGQHDTAIAYVEHGLDESAMPKEILTEEAESKSVDTEEVLLELGQPEKQSVEKTYPCVSKTISENPQEVLKNQNKDSSPENVEDTDGTTKEEECTLKQHSVEVHSGGGEVSKENTIDLNETREVEPQEDITPSNIVENSTIDTSNSESVLKEEFILETETHLGEEKENVKEISSDEKKEQTAEIKQETVKEICRETSSEKAEFEEGLKLSDIKINKEVITTFKDDEQAKDQEVNMSRERQGEDIITSSRKEVSEDKEDLQEKNYHYEGNEHDFIKSREGVDEDTEEMKSSVEIENSELVITTNVSNSTQTERGEETKKIEENNGEKAIEYGQTKIVSRDGNIETKQEDFHSSTQTEAKEETIYNEERNEEAIESDDGQTHLEKQEKEISELQGGGVDVTSLKNALNDDTKETVIGQYATTIVKFEEEPSVNAITKDVIEEELEVKSVHAQENLEVHEDLNPASEPVIEDQVPIENKPQPDQSDSTIENITSDQTLESELEHKSGKDLKDGKEDIGEEVTLATENEIISIDNQNETTKNIILTDKVAVEIEKENERNKIRQISDDSICPIELDNASTPNQEDLANEIGYSKPIPVENSEVTEVKEESQIEVESIQAAEDLSGSSKASSIIETPKVEMHEDNEQTIRVIGEVKDDIIDEASKGKTISVLEDSGDSGNEAVGDVIINEVLLEDEKAKESKSIKDITIEEAKLTQLTSDTDDVCQIERSSSRPDELLDTKNLVEDTEDSKFMADNFNVKDEAFAIAKGLHEDSEITASEIEKLDSTVTDENIIKADSNKETVTLDELRVDDSAKTTYDSISSSAEQDVVARSDESRGLGDMLKLEEKPTKVSKIITEVAEIVPERREVSVTDVQIMEQGELVNCGSQRPSEDDTLLSQNDKIAEDLEVVPSVNKDVIEGEDKSFDEALVIDVQKQEKDLDHEIEVKTADVVSNEECAEIEPSCLNKKEASEFINQENQIEQKKEADESMEAVIPVEDVKASTREVAVRSFDLEVPSFTDATVDKAYNKTAEVHEAEKGLLKDDDLLESKCDQRKPVEEGFEMKQLEFDVPETLGSEKYVTDDVLHEPAKENSKVAENLIGEKDSALKKDQRVEKEGIGESGVKTDDNGQEEEDNEDDEKMGSGSDAPVMVEASKDMDVKVHKKSHNILSGVGSKVKHSIAKVKKAITGKSSPPKSPSPKANN